MIGSDLEGADLETVWEPAASAISETQRQPA